MNILTKIGQHTRAAFTSLVKGAGWEANWLRSDTANPKTFFGATDEYLEGYERVGWVYACVSVIAANVASSPWRLETTTSDVISSDDIPPDLQALLKRPSPDYSFWELKEATQSFLELAGNCYWYLSEIRYSDGRPLAMFPLAPDKVKIIQDSQGQVISYEYRPNLTTASGTAQAIRYDPKEIIHFRMWSPYSTPLGFSPVQAAALAMNSDYSASQWNKNFFYNAAQPGMVIEYPGTLTKDQYNRMLSAVEQRHVGHGRSNVPMITEGGAKAQPYKMTQTEMEFIAGRKFSRDEILSIYGVPPSKVGISEPGGATAREQDTVFRRETLLPKLRRFDEIITAKLVSRWGDDIVFRHEKVVTDDEAQLSQILDRMVRDGIITPNEARERLGKGPVSWGDTWWVPMNYYAVTSSNPASPVNTPSGDEVPLPTGRPPTEEPGPYTPREPKAKDMSERDQRREKVARRMEADEKKFIEKIKPIFASQKAEVEKNFEKHKRELERILEEAEKGLSDKKSAADDRRRFVGRLLPWEGREEEMKAEMKPFIAASFARMGEQAVEKIGREVGVALNPFDLENPRAVQYVERKVIKFAREVGDQTRAYVDNAIRSGIEGGETIPQIADRIGQVFEQAQGYRATLIARTEVTSAQNGGSLEGYRQSEVVEGKEWLAGAGAREWHAEADGQVVGLDEPFIVMGEELDAPGDPSGSPENVCNCRCSISPTIRV